MPDREQQIQELRQRIKDGETGLVDDLMHLLATPAKTDYSEDAEDDPVLKRLRVKKTRRYTMSDAAYAQRTAASHAPVSPAGQRAKSANSWKHGQHSKKKVLSLGKPCRSTCPQYPCEIVEEGGTRPGLDCQDKHYLLECARALSVALENGDLTDLKQVATIQLASTMSVLDELMQSILSDGVYMKSEKVDKEGTVIGYELKSNPSLAALPKLLQVAGLTLSDFMITPAALEKKKTDEDTKETLATIFGAAASGLARAKEKKGGE